MRGKCSVFYLRRHYMILHLRILCWPLPFPQWLLVHVAFMYRIWLTWQSIIWIRGENQVGYMGRMWVWNPQADPCQPNSFCIESDPFATRVGKSELNGYLIRVIWPPTYMGQMRVEILTYGYAGLVGNRINGSDMRSTRPRIALYQPDRPCLPPLHWMTPFSNDTVAW